MKFISLCYVFMFALFIGSFLNVVGIRSPNDENYVSESSHCMDCGHKLSFLDMIPVFSWLFMGGKCRYCKSKISPIYPFGELLTGIFYTVIVCKKGFTLEALIHILLATTLIIATVSDIKYMKVKNKVSIISFVVIFILRIIEGSNLFYYIISGVGAFFVLFGIFCLSGGKMGGADVKIYAPIGLTIGFIKSVESLAMASFVTIGYAIVLRVLGKSLKDKPIPFIPFISIGVILTYIFNLYSALY